MVSGPETSLDKHVEAKHHHVRAADGRGQDDGDALVALCEVAAQDDKDGKEGIADDVILEVGGREDDGDDHKANASKDEKR